MNPRNRRACLGPLVDTHAHLIDPRLQADLPALLDRASDAGVSQIIAVGITAASSAASVELAKNIPQIFATIGVHPNEAAVVGDEDWPKIIDLLETGDVVGIGETGLDRYWHHTPFPQQQEWFDRHLNLSSEHDLPVVIHCRDCQEDIIRQLHQFGSPVRGVVHSFTGSWNDAEGYLSLGLHLSFGGLVTFTNKAFDSLRDVAARMPLDRLLIETDSPYLTPHPLRGTRNEPANVALTAAKLAEIREMSPADLAASSTRNARALFRLPDPDMGQTIPFQQPS